MLFLEKSENNTEKLHHTNQKSGKTLQPLGALIRKDLQIVGAICSVVT